MSLYLGAVLEYIAADILKVNILFWKHSTISWTLSEDQLR